MKETITEKSVLDYFKKGIRLPEEPKLEKKKGLAEGLKKFWEEVRAGKRAYPKPWSKKKAEKEKKEEPKPEKKEEKETEKMKEKMEKVATPEEILKVEEKKEEKKEEKPSKGLGFEFKDKFDINWVLFAVAVIGMIYFFIKMRKTEAQPTQVAQPKPEEEFFEYDAGGGLKIKLPIK